MTQAVNNAALQQASWVANASAWTAAVRGDQIVSRRNGTDAAILHACLVDAGARVLDVGCGEGWLTRTIAATGASVLGLDASAPLIDAARAAGGAASYEVVDYEMLAQLDHVATGPFALIVCNFALLDEDLVPLLSGLARRLSPHGRLVIQTVHPFVASGERGYHDGWREERFAAFGDGFTAAMPWFFRTMASWSQSFSESGLTVQQLREPRNNSGDVLSVIFECHRVR